MRTREVIIPTSLLFLILQKVHNKSSGKSQRQFPLLWGDPCRALPRSIPGRVEPSSLSSAWEQSAKNLTPAPGKPSLARTLRSQGRFPVLGTEESGSPSVGEATRHPPRGTSQGCPFLALAQGVPGARAAPRGRACERGGPGNPAAEAAEKVSAASRVPGCRQGPDESF